MPYCIYLRKSRADLEAEAHGEGETLARHEKRLLELAKRGHYNVTQIYREIVSGETIAARPVVQQLLQEVEEGLWEGVLVVEVERLARGDTIDQGIISAAFKYSNTKIITPLKVYDPSNEFDEEYFEFGLFMSRREYKTINRRMVAGRLSTVNEGKWIAPRAPYGYERIRASDGKGFTLRPLEPSASVVQLIFSLYVDGDPASPSVRLGGTQIARRLKELNIPSPAGNETWPSSSVIEILRNPVYIGKIRWNKHKVRRKIVDNAVRVERYLAPPEEVILVDGLHPPLVSAELFEKAQAILNSSGPPAVPSSHALVNPLAGVLYCGKCGHAMVYHICRGIPRLYCDNPVCDNPSANYSLIESRLLAALSDWLSDYKLTFDNKPPAAEEAALKQKRKLLSRSQTELRRLDRQLDRAHDLLESDVYDVDTFLSRSQELADRIASVTANISSLSASIDESELRLASSSSIVPKVEKLLDVYSSLPDAQSKNDMLREVLEKVVYTKHTPPGSKRAPDDFDLVIYPRLPASPSAK